MPRTPAKPETPDQPAEPTPAEAAAEVTAEATPVEPNTAELTDRIAELEDLVAKAEPLNEHIADLEAQLAEVTAERDHLAEQLQAVPDDDAPKESNGALDEPEVEAVPVAAGGGPIEVGSFIGHGVEHVSRDGQEWTVDPETGIVTAPAGA